MGTTKIAENTSAPRTTTSRTRAAGVCDSMPTARWPSQRLMCLREGHELLHNDRDFDPFETMLGLRVIHSS